MSPSRRDFLKYLGLTGAALSAPGVAAASPRLGTDRRAVTVTGRVAGPEGGIEGVPVTDGVTVTQTGPDGRYELAAAPRRPFVYLSVPSGYRLPTHDTGTARLYRSIDASGGGTATASFRLTPLDRDDEQHAFLFLADPQARTAAEMQQFRDETVPDVQEAVRALGDRPVFGVGGGDLVFDDLSLFSGYEAAVQEMGIPFVQAVGNHDLNFDAPGDPGSTATFRRHFGPEYYSFDRGAVHYVVLDDVYWPGSDGFGRETGDYHGHLDAAQLAWLEQDLALVEDGRPVVVFTHIPPLSTAYERQGEASPSVRGRIGNRAALYELLDPFDAHIVSGHVHENEHRFADGPHEHVVGTVCGAWWTGPVCYDGTPKGYAVYEVDGESVAWRYKATGRAADHQVRAYPAGADPEAPGEWVANVWDATEDWTVVWYEDGIRTGAMARRVGLDPMSRRRHDGDDRPEKHPWVEPQPTAHLYYAPANPDANRVRVEATDPFGRTYAARPSSHRG
ncbi:calcineurin-like phosphoesterase C-terminal domain-containing protein [Salinibacter sp.]|uniref:calcineurin-like phosphoesterase C-terminal domain-containing protein n=1 Tax=Salinibacter sp. TaxID=2065818 RepID=UPI0021E7ADF6|nr:calcineurin-like phosphoesterase C-terminal domain-containing protein [Salinibacter sp.]